MMNRVQFDLLDYNQSVNCCHIELGVEVMDMIMSMMVQELDKNQDFPNMMSQHLQLQLNESHL